MSQAGRQVALVWDDALAAYDFGADHPLGPIRVELTHDLIRAIGLLDRPDVVEVRPGALHDPAVLRLHRPEFVRAVQRVSANPATEADWVFGLNSGDCPTFPGMHDASRLVCAASVEAARQVWSGDAVHAFNPAGGLHHAMPDRAAGFCIYNDPAVAIDWLLEQGAQRVVYLDVDVHHGDGVEAMFADEPRVLTISLHESGRFLFPGTGWAQDIGGPGAPGSVANVPLLPGTDGGVWLSAWDQVVEPLVRAFAPDVIVTQMGCDTHATDPLAHLALTVDDFAEICRRTHVLAHEAAGGRWVALGGGGYQLVQVVPRAWTILFAEMAGAALPEEIPESWRLATQRRVGEIAPARFTDPRLRVPDDVGATNRAEVAQIVAALRQTVLQWHGAG